MPWQRDRPDQIFHLEKNNNLGPLTFLINLEDGINEEVGHIYYYLKQCDEEG
jgi:hypothetical protein